MKTNKEVINALTSYFLEQDKEILCRLLANYMIDMNRVFVFDALPKEEQECLHFRIQKNCEALHKFITDGPSGPLTMEKLNETM